MQGFHGPSCKMKIKPRKYIKMCFKDMSNKSKHKGVLDTFQLENLPQKCKEV